MSRINLSNLGPVVELSREEMAKAAGGRLSVKVCLPGIKIKKIKLPFGLFLPVPVPAIICKTVLR